MCSQVIYGAFSRVTSWKQSQCFPCLVESWQLLKSLHVLVLDAEIISTLQQRIHGDSTDATSSASDEEEKWRRSCSATHGRPADLHLTYLQSVIVESSAISSICFPVADVGVLHRSSSVCLKDMSRVTPLLSEAWK
jgi:hypothetical protein